MAEQRKTPMCWKCAHAILAKVPDVWPETTQFGGCRRDKRIVSYEVADKLCPLVGTEVKIKDSLVEKIKKWLGGKGIRFFRGVLEKHGRIDAVWMEGRVPHPVHFREGMQVRNFMRRQSECREWNDHDFDNNWVRAIERAIE